jgi:hypothetical protein
MYLPDLQDRAKLAINCLTELCDKKRGYIPYFYSRYMDRPISSSLDIWSYGDGLGRSVDALALLRSMTGDTIDHEADKIMIGTLMSFIGSDGLSWCPAEPWTLPMYHTRPAWLQQGTLLALTSLYLLTGDKHYCRLAEMNIQGIRSLTTFHPEGFGDYPGEYFTKSHGWSMQLEDPMHRNSVFFTSVTMPLMRYYRITGYEPALDLASNLIAWALRDHDDGKKIFDIGHFHCQSRLMTAILLRALVTGNSEDWQRGEHLYIKARSLGTQSGWFPEQINNPELNRSNLSETCCLTDMMESAILLAQHRNVKYWNDVEKYAKNHLLVHQIIDTDWFDKLTPMALEKRTATFNNERLRHTDACSFDPRLEKAILGGFAGWGAVTTMSDDTIFSNSNQHCCNAAGARAIYDAWRYAVTDENGTFSVNVHIHRNHKVADIVMEESDLGRLSIQVKQPRQLRVRIPEFVKNEEIQVLRNGKALVNKEENGFIEVGQILSGDNVEVRYPLKSRQTQEKIAPGLFTFEWKGSTVIHAQPVIGIRELFTADRFSKKLPVNPIAVDTEIDSL